MRTALYFIAWLLLGVPLVELIGYWTHRLIFHHGVFGSRLRRPHVQHHLEDYPTNGLRPAREEYKSAADPLWHVIGALIIALLIILTLSGAIEWWEGLALGIGSVIYAKYIVSWMHKQFHVPNSSLKKYRRFQKLVYLHDVHHYARANYGIVFMGMDRIFGTLQDVIPEKAQNIFPQYVEEEYVRVSVSKKPEAE